MRKRFGWSAGLRCGCNGSRPDRRCRTTGCPASRGNQAAPGPSPATRTGRRCAPCRPQASAPYRQNRGSAPRPRLKSLGFRSPRGRSRGRRRSCHPASWRRRGSRRASPCHHNRQRRSLGICRRRRDRSPQPIAGHGSSHSRHGHRDRNRSRSRGQASAAPSTANRQTRPGRRRSTPQPQRPQANELSRAAPS